MKKDMRTISKSVTNILNQDNVPTAFIANLKEIVKNPESKYGEKIGLFSDIPNLEKQKNTLSSEVLTLESEKTNLTNYTAKLNEEIGDSENKKEELEKQIVSLTKKKEEDITKQEELKKNLDEELERKRLEIKELKRKVDENYKTHENHYKEEIRKLEEKFSTSEDLVAIKSESQEHQEFYYKVIAAVSLVILVSTIYAISGGMDVIGSYVQDKELDYFGLFLLKIPYSLIVLGFISGAVILLGKLLNLVEKINNQLRNVSQILAIAKTIDEKTISLFNDDGHKEETQSNNLKYKLISEYLERLGKREFEEKTTNKFDEAIKLLHKFSKIIPTVVKDK